MSTLYRKIPIGLWNNPDFVALTSMAKVLYFWLATGPRSEVIPGLVDGSQAVILVELEEDLGLKPDDFAAAFQELCSRGFAIPGRKLLWLPGLVTETFNHPANPNQVMGWARRLAGIGDCPIRARVRTELLALLTELKPEFAAAFQAEFPDDTSTVSETVAGTVAATVSETRSRRRRGCGCTADAEADADADADLEDQDAALRSASPPPAASLRAAKNAQPGPVDRVANPTPQTVGCAKFSLSDKLKELQDKRTKRG